MNIDPTIDAQLPRPGLHGPRRERQPMNPDVQKRLKQYLVDMKSLKDIWYDSTLDPTGRDKQAFEDALLGLFQKFPKISNLKKKWSFSEVYFPKSIQI